MLHTVDLKAGSRSLTPEVALKFAAERYELRICAIYNQLEQQFKNEAR